VCLDFCLNYIAYKAHAPRLSSAACLAVPHFSTLSHRRHGIRGKKKLLNKKFGILIFVTTIVRNIFLRRIQQDIITNVNLSACKISVILVTFYAFKDEAQTALFKDPDRTAL